MNIEERKKLVARLLFASQQTAMEEAEQIKKQPHCGCFFMTQGLCVMVIFS